MATPTAGSASDSIEPTSGTSTTGSSSAATTEQMNDEVGFIPHPDTSAEPECDPHAEMSCPDGQKCSAAGRESSHWGVYAGAPACFPVLGDLQKGAPCDLGPDPDDGLDDCAANMVCVDWAGGSAGTCREFCDPIYNYETGTCSDPTEFCFSPGCQDCELAICIPACDPLLTDCPQGQSCMQGYNAQYSGFACTEVTAELPGPGEPCDEYYLCGPGAQCVASESIANPACADAEVCCAAYCDMELANACPGKAQGETCQPYFPQPFDPQTQPWGVQYNRLGLCLLPPKP